MKICSLKFESKFENRLFVFDLNRCKLFIRFWFESLHYFFSTKSKFHEIYMFDVEINISRRIENRHFQISFAWWHFQKICFRKRFRAWRWEKKNEKWKFENVLYSRNHFRIEINLIVATITMIIVCIIVCLIIFRLLSMFH